MLAQSAMRLHGNAAKLEGQRFGRLQVLRAVKKTKAGKMIWLCRCDCGAFSLNISSDMRSGKSASCGCFMRESLDVYRAYDLAGKKFKHLTAQRMVGQDKGKNNLWRCLCDCGRTHVTAARNLVRGDTGSCGAPLHNPKCNPDLMPEQRLRGRTYPELTAIRHLALKGSPTNVCCAGVTNDFARITWNLGARVRNYAFRLTIWLCFVPPATSSIITNITREKQTPSILFRGFATKNRRIADDNAIFLAGPLC